MSVGVCSSMNIENTKTYKLFKNELEELLKAGFSREHACYILMREHNAINRLNGYRHADIAYTAFLSLEYLIKQVGATEAHDTWKTGVIEKWKKNHEMGLIP